MTLFALLACTCASPEPPAAEAPRPPPPAEGSPDVVWVTLDTTRTDRFGSYGGVDVTPRFDALARHGTRFEWALTHVPATLPSHCSMFTGLDPHRHGVPSNGFPLGAEHETLAERFASLGYDTIAVVGASVLESAMGLDQGFRIYDEALGDEKERRYEDTADRVNERVLAALERRDPERPLFLWVHYFDAHAPYEAPAEWHERFVDPTITPSWGEGPFATGDSAKFEDLNADDLRFIRDSYTAEVAWQDHNLGLLVDALQERGLLDAMVVMADHGDLLGDHPDRRFGHASSVSLPVIRVPALLLAPGLEPGVFQRPVRSSDVASTLLGALGLGPLGEGVDVFAAAEALPVFVEATKPKSLGPRARKQGLWNNALKRRAVLFDGHYMTHRPMNKVSPDRLWELASEMRARPRDEETFSKGRALLEAWDEQAPPYREPDMDSPTVKALEALGYL